MDTTTCHHCYKEAASIECSSCKVLSYCSEACQKADEGPHEVICQGFEDFHRKKPKPVHHLCLLLPVEDRNPKLIWMNFDTKGKDGVAFEEPNSDALWQRLTPIYSSTPFKSFDISQGTYVVRVMAGNTDFADGSEENRCLTHLMGGKEQYTWRGPILVMRRTGSVNDEHPPYVDVEASDVEAIKKHFANEMSTKLKLDEDLDFKCKDPDPRFHVPNGVKGILISCLGDMHDFNQAKFCQISLSRKDTVFMGGAEISSVSKHMGLTLRLLKTRSMESVWWQMKSDSKDKDGNPFDSSENMAPWPILVNAGLKVDSDTWGHIDYQVWDRGPVGSVVVVRQDKKPLEPRHIEVFESFGRNVIMPAMSAQGEEWEMFAESDMDKKRKARRLEEREELIIEYMSRESFESFLEDYKKMKIDQGYES